MNASPPNSKSENELFGALLAATIHEVKNRFGLLYNDLDALLTQLPTTDQQQSQVESIKSEAQFIGSELVRVLATYKSMSGSFSAVVDQQFAIEFLEETLARHGFTFRSNQIEAELDCDEETSGYFDLNIATIVMDTLLYNAVKAGAKKILLSADEDSQFLYLYLHDNGPGFPEDMLTGQISQSKLSVDKQSTGLGLFFAQQLLASHQEDDRQGGLSLGKSEVLGGAKVTLSLPL
ncbi:MAG: HAMP domain-containing histidine kinase [Pseudomonadales bacterium]|nr:HAMP domain-containing histidine kinase [Pseudomonadales bacterium]